MAPTYKQGQLQRVLDCMGEYKAESVEELAKMYLEENEDYYANEDIEDHLPLIVHAATVTLAKRGVG